VVVEPAALDSLPAGVYRIGGDVSAPVVKYRMDAQYTDLARAQRVTGSVVLRAIVRVHGGLTDIKVVQGLGAGLDEKAVQAAKLWRFVPGEKGGEPVPVEITLEFPFQP
jgi:protein TonB